MNNGNNFQGAGNNFQAPGNGFAGNNVLPATQGLGGNANANQERNSNKLLLKNIHTRNSISTIACKLTFLATFIYYYFYNYLNKFQLFEISQICQFIPLLKLFIKFIVPIKNMTSYNTMANDRPMSRLNY